MRSRLLYRTRRSMLALGAASMAAPAFGQAARAALPQGIVIDALCEPGSGRDVRALTLVAGTPPNETGGLNAQDIADIRASGLTAINATVSAVGNNSSAFEQTLNNIGWFDRERAAHPDVLMQIRTGADLRRAKETGRLGLIYGFQDSALLGPNLDRLALFDNLGVRIIQPTYNPRNLAGDGSQEPGNAGLSAFGHALITELNHRRIVVDLAHGGAQTITDSIVASSSPIAITHTGCRAIVDTPRNVADDNLRAMAEKGGVVGIYCMPFLRQSGQPTAADWIAHIEHAIDVCGEDHVGVGTDGATSGQPIDAAARAQQHAFVENRRAHGVVAAGEDPDVFNVVPEYNDAHRYAAMARDLRARGHSARRVDKIMGGNFARLFSDVWA